jgi:hypothetical protein
MLIILNTNKKSLCKILLICIIIIIIIICFCAGIPIYIHNSSNNSIYNKSNNTNSTIPHTINNISIINSTIINSTK